MLPSSECSRCRWRSSGAQEPGQSPSRALSSLCPKHAPTAEQLQVLELTRLAGLSIRDDVFAILWELMQSDAAPMLVLQLLRSLAGVAPQASPPASASPSMSKPRDSANLSGRST